MRIPSVIGIAGRVGSGKSSLATLLSHESGWPVIRFSDFLKTLAEQRCLAPDREILQQLGLSPQYEED